VIENFYLLRVQIPH